MEFKDKLPILRREKGLSQEGLAELVGISRQAVAKWELGQGYPDIENLIRLSEIFKTSIDRLVKYEDSNYFLAGFRGDIREADQLIGFLLRAKKACYAGNGPKSEPSRPDSHDLQYQEGEYLYIDTYLGGEQFGGEEAVWYQGSPIWCMNYCGRLLDSNFSGDFLKEALGQVTEEAPYRGPGLYKDGDYVYHCISNGCFEWYQGYEEIYCKSVKVYELYFHGGRVK